MPLDEVLPDLYISGHQSAKRRNLEKNGIKTVLSIIEYALPYEPKCDIEYHHINITDTPDQDLLIHFSTIVEIISNGLQRGRVLVHCYAGMSRSVSAIISYLISVFNLDFQTSLTIMKENHRLCFPNPGFGKQLEIWKQESIAKWKPTPAYVYHRDKIMEISHAEKFSVIRKILRERS